MLAHLHWENCTLFALPPPNSWTHLGKQIYLITPQMSEITPTSFRTSSQGTCTTKVARPKVALTNQFWLHAMEDQRPRLAFKYSHNFDCLTSSLAKVCPAAGKSTNKSCVWLADRSEFQLSARSKRRARGDRFDKGAWLVLGGELVAGKQMGWLWEC